MTGLRALRITACPAGAPALARKVLDDPQTEVASEGMPPLLAQVMTMANGERYVLVAEVPLHRRWGPGHLLAGLTHLLGVALVGALFC